MQVSAWARRIGDQQDQVGLADLRPGATHALAFDHVGSFVQPRGVHDVQGHAVDVYALTQDIAGGARDVCDDRGLEAGETVDQARFADIRLHRR